MNDRLQWDACLKCSRGHPPEGEEKQRGRGELIGEVLTSIAVSPSLSTPNLAGALRRLSMSILQNNEWYRWLNPSEIKYFKSEFLELLDMAKTNNVIDKPTWKFLQISFPVTPTFYALPKIHKHATNPPGRPIISGINSLTSKASQVVDDFLILKRFYASLKCL